MTSKAKDSTSRKKRPPKTPKVPSFMRIVIAENIRERMEHVFRESSNRPLALALKTGKPKEGGLSLSTIQRILAGETGGTLDNLEAIASALDLSLYQLMIPNLNSENPQVVAGAMKDEERMYKRWRRAREAPSAFRLSETARSS